ncbi:DNA primase [Pseudooceanicola onchidii]|uniref:DNA primase n=1 Tax=Pseudooceanicola onchidii TaxID=2562279 RepID=UPI0010A9E768|nr:DNA primase [Pseudooceanicola onchidii]
MSLPPGFLDELRTRVSLSQIVGKKVSWDMRKSNQGKGDWWAPCPFHQEKSASFHVDDRKGFYYCFGCHAKGDVISFLKDADNMGFMEAVEVLAQEAGMQMPARDPQAAKKAEKRAGLADVMEMAVKHYRMMLGSGAAQEARAYLDRRGMSRDTQDKFEIGFAPDGWQGLWDYLRNKDVPEQMILAAGLAKPSDKGRNPYDVFRNRIMFPIRDARGRCIAFGGRAMDPNDRAKYLNSPETELFDKGRSLYNHGPAREAVGKGQPLIVAEGYMDVIALATAGFTGAVAPLGTAVTENQLAMLWAVSPEPVVALDGDKAGIRAAMRLMHVALPLLQSGKSLRFAVLPEGKDPDDLIKADGPAAMQAVLDKAFPLVDLLWREATEGKSFDSPERRAALDADLRNAIKKIPDQSLRRHYGDAIKELRYQLFRPARSGAAWSPKKKLTPIRSTTRASALTAGGPMAEHAMREAVILATIISTPDAVPAFEGQLELMECHDPDNARMRDLALRHYHDGAEVLRDAICEILGPETLERLMSQPHVAICPTVRKPGDMDIARMTLAEELAKLKARRGLQDEIAEAEEELSGAADEAVTHRLSAAREAVERAIRPQSRDKGDYELGQNGARISREEKGAFEAILGTIRFDKGRK